MVPAHPLDAFRAGARCGASGSGADAGSEAYRCVTRGKRGINLPALSGALALPPPIGVMGVSVAVVPCRMSPAMPPGIGSQGRSPGSR